MDSNIKNLISNFHAISQKRWIKGAYANNNIGNVGLTFEQEINKNPDNMYFPDYEGIEIKCTTRYSNFPLFLFSTSFDGPSYPEMDRLIEKYGYRDSTFTDKKVLFEDFNYKSTHIVNQQWIFKLEINKQEDKLYLCVYNLKNELIEKQSFVYLQTLYNHLMLKLNTLAIIKASKKNIDNEKYFRYYELSIYKIISFEKFLELLQKQLIHVSIVGRISKSGERTGQYRNKNLEFKIKKENVELLFNKIYYYNYDSHITFKDHFK